MENVFSADGVGAVSLCKKQKGWLLFFVEDDETARNIAQSLQSLSTFLRENKFVVLSTPPLSNLHLQFEAIYGPTPSNSITFVASGGAAFLRWTGTGNLEDYITSVVTLHNNSSAELGEFEYPPEEFLRQLVGGRPSEEKEVQTNGSDGIPMSVLNVSSDNEQPVKKSPAQPRDKTVLQIRSPDGLSVTETFRTECQLSEVREMIARHFSLTERFGLATSFPRYHYASQDYNRSLEELNLWPNAVLMIVPAAPGEFDGSTALQHYAGSIFNWPYTIVTYLWSRVLSVFSFNDRENSQATTNRNIIQPNRQPRPSTSRRQGNVHTLRDSRKDDDKRKTTYNGNSTQQL